MATTRSGFPINFDFFNNDEEQVLFITDDVTGQEMTLEIKNTSDKPTVLKALTGNASATNYHFELVFRPNTLYNNPTAISLASPQFELYTDKDAQGKIKPNADGTHSLFFKSKNDWTLQANEKLVIKLNQMRAEAQDGTRGTRIMLKYQNLLHAGNTETFSGFREIALSIVNHRGKRDMPLHVGFLGANKVLNNGATNPASSLIVRITNISRKGLSLDTTNKAKIMLVMEGGPPSNEWTLATEQQLKEVIVKYRHSAIPPEKSLEATRTPGFNEWLIPFMKLEKGQFIEIQITNIVTTHKAGLAQMFMHFESIPGYWDREYILTVEKTPLVLNDKNVGIDIANPSSKLEVKGKTKLEEVNITGNVWLEPSMIVYVNYGNWAWANSKFLEVKTRYNNDNLRARIHLYAPSNYYENIPAITLAGNYGGGGMVGIGAATAPEATLHIMSTEPGHQSFILGPTNAPHLRMGFNADNSWIHAQGGKPLIINSDGNNVGIGTKQPTQKLEVAGAVKADNFIGAGAIVKGMIVMWSGAVNAVPATWALCDGQNGTPDLRNRFIVGAGQNYNPASVGGQDTVTLSVANLPAHAHTGGTSAEGNHQHWIEGTSANGLAWRGRRIPGETTVDLDWGGGSNRDPGNEQWRGAVNTDTVGQHSHSFTTNSVGNNQPFDNRPAYFALAFIMKL